MVKKSKNDSSFLGEYRKMLEFYNTKQNIVLCKLKHNIPWDEHI